MERAPEPGDIILWSAADTEHWAIFQVIDEAHERDSNHLAGTHYETSAVRLAEHTQYPSTLNRAILCSFGPQSEIIGHQAIVDYEESHMQPIPEEEPIESDEVEHDL